MRLNERYGPVWTIHIGWVEIEYCCPRHVGKGSWVFFYWQYGIRFFGLNIGLQ